jgi:hypothetical protein
VCGRRDKFDYKVPSDLWQTIVPSQYACRVVCLACFDDFARAAGAAYSDAIQELYFAGDRACLKFHRIWGRTT